MSVRAMDVVALLLVGAVGATPAAMPGQDPLPPVPVLMVPGWLDTAEDLAGLGVRLRSAGWPAEAVAAVTFQDPTGGNHRHAHEIAVAVERLRERTGAARVDIIAHSMGGLATRVYLKEHPDAVRRVVFMATPHRGTLMAYLAFGEGGDEMLPRSGFLEALNRFPPVPPGVEALTVRTLLDTHILPGTSATLPGVRDVMVCCPTHVGLTRDLEAFDAVRDFLRR